MNTTIDLSRALSSHPFLEGIGQRQIDQLTEMATLTHYSPNELVFKYGNDATSCCLLLDGVLSVEVFDPRRGPIVMEEIKGPNVVGWSWLIPPYRWCFDVRTLTDTQAVLLSAAPLRNLLDESYDFGYTILKRYTEIFASRIRAARMGVLDLIRKEE